VSEDVLIALTRETLVLTLQIAGPMLLCGLLVGVLVSVLQAVTQVQETALGFLPKAAAMGLAFLVFMPWMLHKLVAFTTLLLGDFAALIR
jgi:flagellar biosynthetic protein FliQ